MGALPRRQSLYETHKPSTKGLYGRTLFAPWLSLGVLLLMSLALYRVEAQDLPFDASASRRLPLSKIAHHHLKYATTIVVTPQVIRVNRKDVVSLKHFQVKRQLVHTHPKGQKLIIPLFERLKRAASKRKKISRY